MEGFFSKKQRDELLAELRIERERKFADRIRMMLLIDEGQKYIDIAKFLFLTKGLSSIGDGSMKKVG